MTSKIEIGVVARAHGIRGEVVIVTHDPDSQTLGELGAVFVGGAARTITKARDTHKGWLVAFEGVPTRNDAERLRGLRVEVEREALQLEDDDVLLSDFLGCEVRRRDGTSWGKVVKVETNDHQDLLVIHDGDIERMLPLVDEFVLALDVDAKLVTIDPPEGIPEHKLKP